MIRYAITKETLDAAIDKKSAKWRARAKKRQNKINKAKKYDEKEGIWSEIKDVYRNLQNDKCAFCERWLAGEVYGSVEHDVEHFRPKAETKQWANPNVDASWHGQGRSDGYYWLAYDLFNYATSCKTCNSPLKGNHFPIAGTIGPESSDIDSLNKVEEPLLIYPISDKDIDPEKLVKFVGISAQAIEADSTSRNHRRAMVTIEFFALNSRRELHLERAGVIKNVWHALEKRDRKGSSTEEKRLAAEDLSTYKSDGHQHANCARSFVQLYDQDPIQAYQLFETARKIYNELAVGRPVS